MFRGFIAIDIESIDRIKEFWEEMSKANAEIKLVEIENLHITLKFLGNTGEEKIREIEEVIRRSVENLSPFHVKLKGTGVFPDEKRLRVVWIGVEDDGSLVRIANKIEEGLVKLGFPKEKREFLPHLTIARVKSQRNKENLIKIVDKYRKVEFGEIRVDSVKLKKSELTPEGPIYTTLKEIKLG